MTVRAPDARGRSAARWFALTVGVLVVVSLGSLVASVRALDDLRQARTLLADRLDPSAAESLRLTTALVDEETGVRGYALTGEEAFLEPFRRGRRMARAAFAALEGHARHRDVLGLSGQLAIVRARTTAWEQQSALPTIGRVREGRGAPSRAEIAASKQRFDLVRRSLSDLERNLVQAREVARRRLAGRARTAAALVIGTGVILLLSLFAAGLVLRHVLVLPLERLARRVRGVARGDFGAEVTGSGATEVVDLAEDVDAMRERILAEVDALRATQAELERSNAELEQFAYVASHDLQEPLRKVASFCQLLAQRYKGRLDANADLYIDYAVDGARRMQELVRDLLAFSRVGREARPVDAVDCSQLVERARASLAAQIEESGAEVRANGLPVVRGDASLLAVVFQNLIANAIRYRSEAPPVVELSAEPDGEMWRLRCSDNGIGIAPEHAERIFAIFQRLHAQSEYAGTGIGLAMCRKIVEYHGGRIWLEPQDGPGATFLFTLPAAGSDDAGAETAEPGAARAGTQATPA